MSSVTFGSEHKQETKIKTCTKRKTGPRTGQRSVQVTRKHSKLPITEFGGEPKIRCLHQFIRFSRTYRYINTRLLKKQKTYHCGISRMILPNTRL